jgi:hypothetical protein
MSDTVFSEDQRMALKNIVKESLDEEYSLRRAAAREREKHEKHEEEQFVTKTFLVSFPGHVIGLPTGIHGQVVMHSSVYIRTKASAKDGKIETWNGLKGEVVACGDGHLLDTYLPIQASNTVSIVEMPEGFLGNLEVNRHSR